LEAIGAKVEQLGVKMKMKYASIEKQSDNFISLLAECLPKYEKEIHGLKYDLNNEEVMKVAAISREACSYHDNGVVLLLIYLVRACKTLETSKISVETIEQKMK
jgi:thiamine pyrophosphokinase